MIARTSAVVLLAGIIGVGLVRPGVPSAEPTVSQFLLAWESRHYLEAAELTTGNPKAVATQLADAYERLDAGDLDLTMLGVTQHGKTAQAGFSADIDMSGSGLIWSYRNSFGLADGSHGWRVLWKPSVIVAGMTSREQLAVVSWWDQRSQLLDSAGQPLAVSSQVYKVEVIPRQLADPEGTAADLAAVTQLSAEQIEGQMDQAPSGAPLALLTLSPSEYSSMRASLSRIPGLQVVQTHEQLFDSIAPDVVGSVGTETASVLRTDGVQYRPGTTIGLTGLQQTFQRQLTGTPSTEVVLQLKQSGLAAVRLRIWPGTAGKPVPTTLNQGVQLAADHALDGLPASAAIVAVQASTGKILAVGSHTAAGLPSLSPLAGRYQPGQAFTIVSSAAIMSGHPLKPGAPVPCLKPGSVGRQNFRNEPPVPDLGSNPSFRTDFAHACWTAFADQLSYYLKPSVLTKVSQEFGIGGWQLPVSSYFSGQTGPLSSGGMLAADVIGTGDVQVSPLGMALAAGVVDSGSWHAPSLVTGLTAASSDPSSTISPKVLDELRGLMREAAKTGPNAVADVGGDVYAQVGSAPYGTGRLWINWFVGYQGDVAFAVAELGQSPSPGAASLAGSFLHNIRAGS